MTNYLFKYQFVDIVWVIDYKISAKKYLRYCTWSTLQTRLDRTLTLVLNQPVHIGSGLVNKNYTPHPGMD